MSTDTLALFRSCCQALGVEVYGRQQPADLRAARLGFERLAAENPDQCDLWRGVVVAGGPDRNVIEQAHRTIDTCGDLLAGSDVAPGALDFSFDTGLYVHVSAPGADGIKLACAAQRCQSGQYEAARAVLDEQLRRTQPILAHWALAVVYFRARRWSDVREVLGPVRARSQTDQVLHHAITVAHGIATAYLGIWESALETLEAAGRGPIPAASAEALFVAGLCARALNRPDHATTLLNEALGSPGAEDETRDRIVAALADPGYGIHPTTAARIAARTEYWDPESEPTERDFTHSLGAERRAELKAEADAELDGFVGMDDVKDEIARLDASVIAARRRAAQGLKVRNRSLHLILKGPPGVGKTSIARLVGKRLAASGILPSETFVEVSRSELVDDRIGGTEKKVAAVLGRIVDDGVGGVLFIDEAYKLTDSGSTNDFGPIAVAEIMRAMLDYADILMVIIAGYADKIDEFLDSNEGLRGRFGREIVLPSYDVEQLVEITLRVAAKADSRIDDIAAVRTVYEQMQGVTVSDANGVVRAALDVAGNARFVNNLIEQAENEREYRLSQAGVFDGDDEIDGSVLETITAQDISAASARLLKQMEADIAAAQLLNSTPRSDS